MDSIDAETLRTAINRFSDANILVIGDIIVDHFIWGSVSRISPEAPVPVVSVTDENLLLGGAANVLHNLYAMGAKATICGIIGDDAMGDHFLDLLTDLSSPTIGVIKSTRRPTIIKTRIIAQSQQVVRFDREEIKTPSEENFNKVLKFLDDHIQNYDVVIVSDYAKGIVSPELMNHLRAKAKEHGNIPVVVDPKPKQMKCYNNTSILTPNNNEAELMSGITIDSEENLLKALNTLQKKLDVEGILITRGEAGMTLLEKGKKVHTIPTVAKEVYDVTGAGDTVIATLSLGLAAGLSYLDAAKLANIAAGIVVGKVGTATASTIELLEAIQ